MIPRFRVTIFSILSATVVAAVALGASRSPQQTTRPKIYSIAYVRFKSVDVEKSRAFYTSVLGLKAGADSCKGLPDLCFAVNPYQRIQLSQTGASERGSFLEQVGFNVSEVATMHAYLSANG